MTVLRLDPLPGASVDRAIAAVECLTLVRRSDGAFVDIEAAEVGRLVRTLAFAGVAAAPSEVELTVPRALLPALGRDLAPLASGLLACDIVRVRRLTLGEATRELLRRPLGGMGRPREAARERARGLLRGDDALLAWGRQAWAARDALRTRVARRSLRPVIFDRSAIERTDLDGRTLASAGALTRWLFA